MLGTASKIIIITLLLIIYSLLFSLFTTEYFKEIEYQQYLMEYRFDKVIEQLEETLELSNKMLEKVEKIEELNEEL